MKKRILFVDDEPNILDGLRRMLRGQRDSWEMEFVTSGEQALAMMDSLRFDAIISDMRMPGMDGAVLLEEVKHRHPDSLRFVLSGHSDQELVMRSVGPSHQYLSKPCSAEKLKSVLIDAFALHDLLACDSLRALVSGMRSLPSMPDVYRKMVHELQSEDSSITEIAKLIEEDTGITARVLQLVNSSYFGLGRKITRPSEAVCLLGASVLKGLVLANGVFSQFDESLIHELSLHEHQNRSLAIASLAKEIALAEGLSETAADQAFLGGLLHDMGMLVLAVNAPDDYLDAIKSAEHKQVTLYQAEQEKFGATHAEVGAYMLGLWGIDQVVVISVAYHHHPEDIPCRVFGPPAAVFVANMLIPEIAAATGRAGLEKKAIEYIESLGLSERLPIWQAICEQHEQRAA